MIELKIPQELGQEDRLVTEEFQEVLDHAHGEGGARVTVLEGTYHIGSVRLYGHTELHLEEGVHLMGSTDIADYTDWDTPTTLAYAQDPFIAHIQGILPHYIRALITAADAEEVAITGEEGSTIDGVDCTDPAGEEGFRGAMGMRICRCRNVRLSGYTFKRSANWSHQVDSCTNVLFEGVTVLGGHDGFNIHHCTNVEIARCMLKCGDDCIAGFDARNVLVDSCYFNTACNAFRLGATNLFVTYCRIKGPGEYPHILEGTYHMHAAIKYYAVKGDTIREDACNWCFADCRFENPGRLINYDYGSAKGYQTERPLVDLHLVRCTAEGISQSSFFKGRVDVPGTLELEDCQLQYAPDEANVGKPCIQLGEGAKLLQENVSYEGEEPLMGPRVVEEDEVKAEVLKKATK